MPESRPELTETMWLGLAGQRAVVTGGGGGIGRATALKLLNAGVDVVVLDRDEQTCERTVIDAEILGYDIAVVACDVADASSVTQAATGIGAVDLLVNTAGIVRPGALIDVSPQDWAQVLNVNLSGAFHTAQAFAPGMIARGGGAMVHIASIAATNPQANSSAYSASKAGLILMSQQLAFELGPSGIRSNTISPGLVRTPMTEAYYQAPGVAERRNAAVPIGRVARPCDVAEAVLFLLSYRAAYINGADLVVDGGFSLNLMSTVPRPGH